jgi:hypothetical protein
VSLPFSRDQFFQVFSQYNQAVWPAPWIFYGLAILSVVVVILRAPYRSMLVTGILALFWAWMGIVYHWMYFSAINPAARVFAALFVIQAALLLWFGVSGKLAFRWRKTLQGSIGAVFLAYALLVYPLLNQILGHRFPETPTFGLPCPTTIFTFGLLWWLDSPLPRLVFLVPLIWAAIGGSAAFILGVPQDLGLLVAGLFSVVRLLPAKLTS